MSFPVIKVEYISLKSGSTLSDYLEGLDEQPSGFGGKPKYRANVDHYFIGGTMAYVGVLIDEFPSIEDAVKCDQERKAIRERHLEHRYAILVRHNSKIPKRVKSLHWLSPVLNWLFKAGSVKPVPDMSGYARPAIAPTNESVEELKGFDQERPVFMMNLNKFYKNAQYGSGKEMTGEKAYGKYSKSIFPYLVSVKGYPAIYGRIVQVLETDSNSQLPDEWDEFIWVSYPSRKHFLRLMTNAPEKGIGHRNAGLERAVVFPCSEI